MIYRSPQNTRFAHKERLMNAGKTLPLLSFGLAAALTFATQPALAQTANVLKSHNDLANTGQNLQETTLTPALLRSGRFDLLFRIPVDPGVGPNVPHTLSGSQIYAQPLYMAGLSLPGGARRNVLFVATEHDSIYAFDADTGAPLWKRTDFVDGQKHQTFPGNGDLQPEIGITGTPVIDPATGTLYVVVLTRDNGGLMPADYHQHLCAIDCATGANKFAPGFPREITATSTGTEGRPETGPIPFRPDLANQRCGLVLSNGQVYIAWASYQDKGPYHGWVMAYDARSGTQRNALNISPSVDRYGAGIWQSGGAPSIDAAGNLFISTGNGVFNAATGNWGECFLKIDGKTLQVKDYFSPFNRDALDAGDADLGTSGLLLLPDSVGGFSHPHLMFSGGKVGSLYLVDRDNLGHFDAAKNNVVQEIELPGSGGENSKRGYGLYSVPAYFNGSVYYLRTGEYLKRVPVENGHLNDSQTVANTSQRFGFPGATPSISANGAQNGIVWVTESYYPAGLNMQDHADPGHMRLHAYDATTLDELFNSGDTAPTIDGVVYRNFMKFNPPTVTNGHVYVATGGSILAYGVKSSVQGANVTAQVKIKRHKVRLDKTTGRMTQIVTLINRSDVALLGPVSLMLDDLNAEVRLNLENESGNGTTSGSGPSGVFYHNFPGLAPKQSVSTVLTFLPSPLSGPKTPKAKYKPRVLAGGEIR
ncbi:Outer membrane protein assembly factor BamB, contains PQQ-like beta-propeller repeat [Abditibacterium utsteinense]|uniref:Outer membrane protein assembly factor BamB, contains PQQ-like beta-propeller repeat n=2 Tax=Abditibacterium utsteinense TaxID=1960156 RepID=A0A2S8SNS1_9BACT|nr:Outer membrane protein assembly factor BamB, contains PQQ-like beta-propeller repeat [Abditibacterium utsteinense]